MLVIGELINGMFKNVGKAIANKDKSVIQKLAKEQAEAGAGMLDVNVGPAAADAVGAMKWLVETIQEVTDTPLCLDSTKPNVIEEGLKLIKNKAMINSTTADKEKLDVLLPMAKQYGAGLIGLTMDKKGIPRDRHQRSEFAAVIISASMEAGLGHEDIYLDPIILPVNVAQPQSLEVLEAIREFSLLSDPPPKTVVGLSNVSQGTENRSLINRTFLVMALALGLKGAIMDPLDKELMDAAICAELILNKHIYCASFLDAYRKK
ncbi:MAG: dihydropteroate synthase [Candidatus Omnitrophota bacterium]|nr:MAG: dihydropteroate synthase [Candidatus Omnitrophota bacterium]